MPIIQHRTLDEIQESLNNGVDQENFVKELIDYNLDSLNSDELIKFMGLVENHATLFTTDQIESLLNKVKNRRDVLLATGTEVLPEDGDEAPDQVLDDQTSDEFANGSTAENFAPVDLLSFEPQKVLQAWHEAQTDEEQKAILEDLVQYLKAYDLSKLSTENIDNVYAINELIYNAVPISFMGHPEIENLFRATAERIDQFEESYGLNRGLEPSLVKTHNAFLDQIQTNELLDEESKDLLNRLTVVSPSRASLELALKEHVSQDQPDEDISLILERIRFEAQMKVANASSEIPEEKLKAQLAEEFQNRLQYHVAVLVGANQVRAFIENGQSPSQEDFSKIYQDLLHSDKALAINPKTLAAWHADRQNNAESALSRMALKDEGLKDVVLHLKTRLYELDQKCHQKYGKWYDLAKTALKSGGWGIAYGVGSALGPVGITAVATASFANNAYKQYKEFKKAKEQDETLTFKKYMKENKLAAASLALGAFSTVTAVSGLTSDVLVKGVKLSAGTALGLAGAFKASSDAYKKTKGSRFDKTKAALKTFGASAVSFAVGWWAGQKGGELAGEALHNVSVSTQDHVAHTIVEDNLTPEPIVQDSLATEPIVQDSLATEPIVQDSLATEPVVQDSLATEPIVQDSLATEPVVQDSLATEPVVQDSLATEPVVEDNLAPEAVAIDLNHLTPEQEHDLDMLFKRAPTEAYEVLKEEGIPLDRWMNSHDLAKAYDSLSDAQKTTLIEYADQRFDAHGNFQDVEGKTSAEEMEAQAKAWSQSHSKPFGPNLDTSDSEHSDISLENQTAPMAPLEQPLQTQEQTPLTTQEQNQEQDGRSIRKIRIHGDDIKIVGVDEDGKRFVEHIKNENGYPDAKVKFTEAQTKVVYNSEEGRIVHKMDLTGNGKIVTQDFENGRQVHEMDSATREKLQSLRATLHGDTSEQSAPKRTQTNTSFNGNTLRRGGQEL